MPSILDIVKMINSELCGLIPGMQTYGIAQIVPRDNVTMPAEDERYIGIDDTYPAQIYHKINGIQIAKQASGYGDQVNVLYTYQMSMIVFINRSRTWVKPEDFILKMQMSLPQKFTAKDIMYGNINFTSANLNDQQVFTQEYRDQTIYRLGQSQNLFQVNYDLAILYKPGCVDPCITKEVCKN